eukprot:766348-Hanusia_phi.AAC.5
MEMTTNTMDESRKKEEGVHLRDEQTTECKMRGQRLWAPGRMKTWTCEADRSISRELSLQLRTRCRRGWRSR